MSSLGVAHVDCPECGDTIDVGMMLTSLPPNPGDTSITVTIAASEQGREDIARHIERDRMRAQRGNS